MILSCGAGIVATLLAGSTWYLRLCCAHYFASPYRAPSHRASIWQVHSVSHILLTACAGKLAGLRGAHLTRSAPTKALFAWPALAYVIPESSLQKFGAVLLQVCLHCVDDAATHDLLRCAIERHVTYKGWSPEAVQLLNPTAAVHEDFLRAASPPCQTASVTATKYFSCRHHGCLCHSRPGHRLCAEQFLLWLLEFVHVSLMAPACHCMPISPRWCWCAQVVEQLCTGWPALSKASSRPMSSRPAAHLSGLQQLAH